MGEEDIASIIAWQESGSKDASTGVSSSGWFPRVVHSIYNDIKELMDIIDPRQNTLIHPPKEVIEPINHLIAMLNDLLKLDYYQHKNEIIIGQEFRRIKDKMQAGGLLDSIRSDQKFRAAGKAEMESAISRLKELLPLTIELEKLEKSDIKLNKQGKSLVSKKKFFRESENTLLGNIERILRMYQGITPRNGHNLDITILENVKSNLKGIKKLDSYLEHHIEYFLHLIQKRFIFQLKTLLQEYEKHNSKPVPKHGFIKDLEMNFLDTYKEVCRLI